MRGPTLRRFFICVFVLLPVQFGAAKLCVYLYGVELWPAVMAPSFSKVDEAGNAIEVPHPQIVVTFADAERREVPVRVLFAQLPDAYRRSVMRSQFSHDYGLSAGAGAAPATVQWVRRRLRTLYPERMPRRFKVRWETSYYRRQGNALGRVRTEAAHDSVSVRLPPSPPARAR